MISIPSSLGEPVFGRCNKCDQPLKAIPVKDEATIFRFEIQCLTHGKDWDEKEN